MASPEAEQIRELLRSMGPIGSPTIAEQRTNAEAMWPAFTADCEGASYEPVDAGGVPAEKIVIEGADHSKVVYYLHGGGYTVGSIVTHRKLAAHIAKAAGRDGLLVDYRLAPEHPFPAGLDDAVTAYRWLVGTGVAPTDIAIAGDSAGGGLTLATALRLRDEATGLPGALVTLSPWTDLAMTGESLVTRREVDVLISPDDAENNTSPYIGDDPSVDAKHPLVSPLYADPTGLPRLLIQVGDDEVLLSDSTRFAESAEIAGVDVTIEIWPEMLHVFQMGAGTVPEATEAIAKIGAWLKAG